jgi:hypothetical protein
MSCEMFVFNLINILYKLREQGMPKSWINLFHHFNKKQKEVNVQKKISTAAPWALKYVDWISYLFVTNLMDGVFRSSYAGVAHNNAVMLMYICWPEYVLKFMETLVKHFNSLAITHKSASNGRNLSSFS